MDKELEVWTSLRKKLSESYDMNCDWQQAIKQFHRRLTSKYFNPIKEIIDLKKFKGEGFTILAAQCSLIEVFAAFRKGKVYNYNKAPDSPSYEYKNSGKLYIRFLETASIFQDNFYSEAKGNKILKQPYNAREFYSQVRCGLIHEGKTKGDWTINVQAENNKDHVFIRSENGKKRIYRTALNNALLKYLNEYCMELEDPDNHELRKLFARKLDDLYDIAPEPKNYNWWEDDTSSGLLKINSL